MIGENISHYKIVEKLGSGGMGIVYRALDENLGRDVAIKVLHREVMHDPDRLALFEREAKAIAKLAHPNILAIHDFGNTSGIAFAITELLEGETLGRRLTREHLHWRKAVDIAASISEGLAAAHAKGITHRDIKPDNVFLTTDGRVKILDFGLAHTLLPSITDPLAPTISVPCANGAAMMGTVAYMTPEQLRGEEVDARSDIFALGCVLYEMLTGQSAFSRGSFALTVTAILMDPAPEVQVSGVEAAMELNRIIGRCLEKNPRERFQSAGDLAFALRSLSTEKHDFHVSTEAPHSTGTDLAMAGATTKKRRDTPIISGMRDKWVNRILIPVALICSLALVALWISGKREMTLAVLPPDNEDPDKSGWGESFAQKLHTKISELDIIKVKPRITKQNISSMGSDYIKIAKKLNASVLLRWNYRITKEDLDIYVELIDGRTGNAESKLFQGKSNLLTDTITQIAGHVVQKLRPRLGPAEMDQLECVMLYGKGRDALANRSPDSLEQAIRYFKEALKKNPKFALAHVGIADSYNMIGIYGLKEPREVFPLAKEAATEALKIDNLLAEAHISLGFALERHDFQTLNAQLEYVKAIRLSSSNYETLAAAHHRYGVSLIDSGQYSQAIDLLQLAQKEDPSSQIVMADLARAYIYKGDFKEAILISEKTIEQFPTFAPAYRYRGIAYEQAGDFRKAIEDLEYATKYSRNSPLMRADLGHVYASAGEKDKANAILSDLLQEKKNGDYRSCFLIAQIYACLDNRDAALGYLNQALEEKDPFLLSLEVDPIFKSKFGHNPEFTNLIEQIPQR